jgi:haloalkane dehalogenase
VEILRTPDERFEGLEGWPFAPRYLPLPAAGGGSLRLHYVDEGPANGRVVLLMHGEPSWAYLYRKIIAALAGKGRRVIAPDLIGFGRSDKPSLPADYIYEAHVGWMSAWLSALDLRGITLFCQDWGGLIGLRLVAASPERFSAVVAANTGLPTGSGLSAGFKAWLDFSQRVPELPISKIVDGACLRDLTPGERAAYDAPFPEERYKAGARQFPLLVPATPEHASVAENKAAWKALEKFDKPFLTAFSDSDPVTKGGEAVFQARIPGARGQPHVTLHGGHFIQEDAPQEIADLIDALMRRSE